MRLGADLPLLEAKDPRLPKRGWSRRGRSINERLLDSILRHRHAIFYVENGIARDLIRVYREALDSVELQLKRLAEREGALSNLALIRRDRLRTLEARLAEALQIGGGVAGVDVVTGALETLAEREWLYQMRLLRKTLPTRVAIDLAGPDLNLVRQILDQKMGGVHYAERFARNHGEAVPLMRRSLATSAALGEGYPVAARRMRGAVGGLLQHRAVLIARSEVQRAANRTAQEFYVRNSDVVKGITIVETLDVRTCLLCILQDGKFFPVDEGTGSLPPYHAGCRGFVCPVTRSWEELGIKAKELPAGTRASMNGEVPAPITYQEWFPSQSAAFQREVLGASRYELWKNGKVEIKDFVKSGRILSVRELPVHP